MSRCCLYLQNCKTMDQSLVLIDLPEELLEHIFSFLSFHNVSEIRLVCQRFNKHSQQLLNQGFSHVDKFHAQIQKRVKSQLPRRESERRNHPLARHVDILSAIETRLSLLGMTYMRYMDMDLCCFIPGKVLDELYNILRALQHPGQPPRAHEFLQELRDISSMAMEQFEEKVVPGLKLRMPSNILPFPFSRESCSSPEPQPGPSSPMLSLTSTAVIRAPPMRQEIVRLQNQLRVHGSNMQQCRKDISDVKNRVIDHRKKSIEQEKKIQSQEKVITEQGGTIEEQERKISDLSKKVLEYDLKFAEVFSELSRMKDPESCASSKASTPRVIDVVPEAESQPGRRKGTRRAAKRRGVVEEREVKTVANKRKRT